MRKAIVTEGNYTVREMPTGAWGVYPTRGEELDLNKHSPVGYFEKKADAVSAAKTMQRFLKQESHPPHELPEQ